MASSSAGKPDRYRRDGSAFDRISQAVKKRHLCRLDFAPRNYFRKKARLINLWKHLALSGTWRPFQFEQI